MIEIEIQQKTRKPFLSKLFSWLPAAKEAAHPVISHAKALTGTYPKWKHLVPYAPSFEDFNKAWEVVFDFPIEECNIVSIGGNEVNFGFTVMTPKGGHSHGGFGHHTETPRFTSLLNRWGESHIYYSGCGCTWSTDADGMRYYLIDKVTGKPTHWDDVYSTEIIRRFFANSENKKQVLNNNASLKLGIL